MKAVWPSNVMKRNGLEDFRLYKARGEPWQPFWQVNLGHTKPQSETAQKEQFQASGGSRAVFGALERGFSWKRKESSPDSSFHST